MVSIHDRGYVLIHRLRLEHLDAAGLCMVDLYILDKSDQHQCFLLLNKAWRRAWWRHDVLCPSEMVRLLSLVWSQGIASQ